MSRKYREYKAKRIEYYGKKGIFPPYKMTLSLYKRIKREKQRHKKLMKKFLGPLRRGAILVISGE